MKKSLYTTIKEVAFTSIFASVYAFLSLWSVFPVLGAPGKFITLSSVISPLMGLILGFKVGFAAASIGGILISLSGNLGAFGPLSFIPGASAALFSGLVREGRRVECILLYSLVFMLLSFCPNSGPVWTFPLFLWLQVLCLAFILSPFLPKIASLLAEYKDRNIIVGVASVSFTSTLFSQAVGSLMFEVMFNRSFTPEGWTLLWQSLTVVYPLERALIVFLSTLIGSPLIRILKTQSLVQLDKKVKTRFSEGSCHRCV